MAQMTSNLGHVLIIEDSPDDVKITLRALERWNANAQATVAEDGLQGLEVLRSLIPQLPDLVLLDLKLPVMGGLELLKEMRSKGPLKTVRVVIFTSSDELSDVTSAMDLGATGYVQKPIDYEEFIRKVQAIAGGWNGDVDTLIQSYGLERGGL